MYDYSPSLRESVFEQEENPAPGIFRDIVNFMNFTSARAVFAARGTVA